MSQDMTATNQIRVPLAYVMTFEGVGHAVCPECHQKRIGDTAVKFSPIYDPEALPRQCFCYICETTIK